MIETFRGVYFVPETQEIVIFHKLEIKPAVNLNTNEMSQEVFVTLETARIGKQENVVVSKDNLQRLVYVGEFL
jgi:hypothetical protein